MWGEREGRSGRGKQGGEREREKNTKDPPSMYKGADEKWREEGKGKEEREGRQREGDREEGGKAGS